jgi:hypothetical protein
MFATISSRHVGYSQVLSARRSGRLLFVSESEHHQLSETELRNMRDRIASAMVHLHEQLERIETFLLFAKLHDRNQQAAQKPA